MKPGTVSEEPWLPPLLRRVLPVVMMLVFFASIATWYATRDTLPGIIRIASGERGGLYYLTAQTLKNSLEIRSEHPVEVVETRGTVHNRELLVGGGAHLAIIQAGAVPSLGMAVVAPLYHDALHVIVRRESDIHAIHQLQGRAISIGPAGSGMRQTATRLLEHYRVEIDSLQKADAYFGQLETDPGLEGAIVTSGLLNPDLNALLSTQKYRIIPVDEADAFIIHNPSFVRVTIPRGLYHPGPVMPSETVQTVATTAILVAETDAPPALIETALESVYTDGLSSTVTTLIPRREAAKWDGMAFHSAARTWYDPLDSLGFINTVLESLAAGKELLFAFAAGLYLAWNRWHRRREQEEARAIKLQRVHLDEFLNETILIEKAQMETMDPDHLKSYLDQVTRIKLKALDELSSEELRGDRLFHIFITQCASLTAKIQAKITAAEAHREETGVG